MTSRGKCMIINRRCKYFISHEPNDEDKTTDFFTLFILFINYKNNSSHMWHLICIWYLHKAMHADQVLTSYPCRISVSGEAVGHYQVYLPTMCNSWLRELVLQLCWEHLGSAWVWDCPSVKKTTKTTFIARSVQSRYPVWMNILHGLQASYVFCSLFAKALWFSVCTSSFCISKNRKWKSSLVSLVR